MNQCVRVNTAIYTSINWVNCTHDLTVYFSRLTQGYSNDILCMGRPVSWPKHAFAVPLMVFEIKILVIAEPEIRQ